MRMWRLLDRAERRAVLGIVPLLVLSAFAEVVGVATVVPFLAILADPESLSDLPFVGAWLVERGVADATTALRWVGAALAVMLLAMNALVIATNWWLFRFSWELNHALSSRLLRRYLGRPYAYMLTRNSGTLANKVIVEVRQLVADGVRAGLEAVTRGVVITALVAFLVVLDPTMAVVVFALFAGAYGGIFVASRRYLRRIGRDAVAAGAARLTAVNEALGGFKDLKVSGREASAFARYEAPSRRYAQVQAAVMAIAGLPRYALEAVAVGGMVIVASLMAGRAGSFADTLPLLGAYAFAGLRLMPAMQNLFSALARLRFVRGSLEAVEEELLDARDEDPLVDAPEPLPFTDTLALRGVTFAYPDTDAPTLQGLDLTLHRRRSLAIVGRTGSGKSTLVDVLLGLLEPAAGAIELDGVAVLPEQQRAYRRLFGYVPQSIYLLDDTIERNVAFGIPDAAIDAAAVRRACALAQIGEFIEHELPEGYATVVGERGVRLSGGQRQRIGIARALYHGPEVLVFDEATSALDVHTERQVYQALEGLARTHTVVTIAHRLETVATVDHVVVLDHGAIVDAGPPGEVLERYGAASAAGGA